MWDQLLQLLPPGVGEVVDCVLLEELLELGGIETTEELLHLLETGGEQRELEGGRELPGLRVTEVRSFRLR